MSVDVETVAGPVELLYRDYQGLVEDLQGRSPSGLVALNRSYHKVILIAAASSLENQVKAVVESLFRVHGRDELGTFVAKKVLARGYHGLFDWDRERARMFFSNFGPDCAKSFDQKLKSDEEFSTQHSSFMRIGSLRNQLVHQDYATYVLDVTPEEILGLYKTAVLFPRSFESIVLPPIE